MRMTRQHTSKALMLITIFGVVLAIAITSATGDGPDAVAAPDEEAPAALVGAQTLEDAIVSAADGTLESVVSIEVEVPYTDPMAGMGPGGPFGSPFGSPFGNPYEFFFGPEADPGEEAPSPAPDSTEPMRKAGGSGVVHAQDGYIVTNNHVVEDAHSIRVVFHDGSVAEAVVVGTDPESDLAVIKVDRDGLQPVRYAAVDGIRPGQFAVAVGMPFGLDYSVTVGHVSALGRGGLNPSDGNPFQAQAQKPTMTIQNFIQTDTSINPGNSGDPLVNLRGEVMGINSIVHGGIGGGFGFAIPSDIVQQVASQLIETGHVSRAWLGISMSDLDYEMAQALEVDAARGAVVESVVADSPAEKAKLKRGDVIVAVDGEDVKDGNDVIYLVAGHRAGDRLDVTYLRDGRRKTVRVHAGDRDEGLALGKVASAAEESDDDEANAYGLALESVDGAVNEQLGRDKGAAGVFVRSVVPNGPADRSGLRPGDVILDVDGKAVSSPKQLFKALEKAAKPYVPLTVEREGSQRFVALKKQVD